MQLLMSVTCFQRTWVRKRCCGTASAFCFSPRAGSQSNDNNETAWTLTLTVASCYQTLVTSTSAGTTQGASVYLTENARYFRASEHLGALTHDPGTWNRFAASFRAFSSRDVPANFGIKAITVKEGCSLFLWLLTICRNLGGRDASHPVSPSFYN